MGINAFAKIPIKFHISLISEKTAVSLLLSLSAILLT